jgi:hypothetical protein
MFDVSPRTRVIPLLLVGSGALLGACGEPPQALPSSPPYVTPSPAPISLGPSIGFPLPTGMTTTQPQPTTTTTYPAFPTPTTVTTTPPETVQATPTPSHAAKCPAEPTGAQILALIKGRKGIPNKPMRVFEGPFCSGIWSFTTAEVTGAGADDLEPLMVVATGTGDSLAHVASGSDVCIDRVQTSAPPGIRVLACGF